MQVIRYIVKNPGERSYSQILVRRNRNVVLRPTVAGG
jgi:hypothetical protein